MKIRQCLYVKNSDKAVEMYKEVFGLKLGYHVKNPDGTYFHSELYKDDEEILDVVESKDGGSESIVQLSVTFAGEQEVKRAYELLSAGGTVKTPIGPLPWSPCAADIVDKFGVWWYISAPGHQPPDDYDPNAPWDPGMYKNPNDKG